MPFIFSMRIWLFSFLVSFAVFSPVQADESSLGWHDKTRGLLVSRLNPDVLMLEVAKGERLNYHYSEQLDMIDGFVEYAGAVRVSPASSSVVFKGQWLPLAVLKFNGEAEYGRYFGNFSNVLLFDDVNADYGDQAREDLEDEAQAAWFSRYKFEAVLRARLGPVVGRYVTSSEYFDFDVDDQGQFIYEPSYDLLIKNRDTVEVTKWELFYALPSVAAGKRLIGIFHETNDATSSETRQKKLGLQSLWGQNTYGHDVLWVAQLAYHTESRYREYEWMGTLGLIKPF